MRLKLFGFGLLALAVLAAVLVYRAVSLKPPPPPTVALAPAIPVDIDVAAKHLGEAIRFKTISHQDPHEDEPVQWAAQRDWIAATYPHFSGAAQRVVYPDSLTIYTWKGSDPALKPVVMMAHQDVVPVTEATLKDWRAQPFGGEVKEGAVWGRGSIDDKGSLIALLEAVDALAARGFTPKRTLMIVSGAHEEVSGGQLPNVIYSLAAQGLRTDYVLDEGLWMFEDGAGKDQPVGLIAVAEKGYATLRMDAHGAGGHSSVPPKETAVATLAKAITAIVDHPFPLKLTKPSELMLKALAPTAAWPNRLFLANLWLFKPLVVQGLASTPGGAAQMHTTIAPTMLQGSPKDNVLPQDAVAWINYRIAPGDSSADIMNRAKAAVGALPVSFSFPVEPNEPTAVASTDTDGYRAIAALVQETEHVPSAPALMVAATDSRYLAPLTPNIYKFTFMRGRTADSEMLHGVNEHMTLTNLSRLTQFYARLIATTTAR